MTTLTRSLRAPDARAGAPPRARRRRHLLTANAIRLLIGASTNTLAEAQDAVRNGADLCGVGPMFLTTTKHKPVLAGPAYLREYLADPLTSRVPHLAIGGITPATVRALASAGCRGIAVSSAVCGASEPGEVCRSLLASLPSFTSG